MKCLGEDECELCHDQARNQLGTPGGAKCLLRGGKIFCRGGFAPPLDADLAMTIGILGAPAARHITVSEMHFLFA